MGRKFLVLAESRGGQLRNVALEAVAAARQLAGDGEVVAALLGDAGEDEANRLIRHGADRAVIVRHDSLKQYTTDAWFQAVLQLKEREQPGGLVMGHTALGKDLAPRIAARLQSGLVSDVVRIEAEGEVPVFTRPIYAGKAFERLRADDSFLFVTIRPNNIPFLPGDDSRSGRIDELQAEIRDLRAVVREVVRKTASGVDLTEARIIVSGGRGVKSAEGFQPLRELAEVLGAAVGASRGACDAGYCDYSMQIGQTGTVVTPDLYFAIGISGAIQHVAGMSNSKVIVAINKDPEAPIFDIADYGIVGDLFEVVPVLTEELRQALSAK